MKKPGDLVARVGVAVVGIPVVLGALWAGGWVLGAMIAVAAWIGAMEFYRMVEAKGGQPFSTVGAAVSGGMVLLATYAPTTTLFAPPALATLLGTTGALFALAMWRRWPEGEPLNAVTSTVGGILYVGLPLAFVPMLRALPEGARSALDTAAEGAGLIEGLSPLTAMSFVLLPLLTTWAGDSAAYFVGHAVGRTKLAPKVSPGKTIEGSLGGLLGAVGAAVLVTMWWIEPHPTLDLPLVTAAWMGAVIGVATQLGDLVESLLKREAGIKDSGSIFPGHGGMLDRLDALLWAFPVTWILLSVTGVIA